MKNGFTLIRTSLRKNLVSFNIRTSLRKNLVKVHCGFTLIETLVVIAIISALSLLGMIQIKNFQEDTQIDSAANEILSALRFARSKSEQGEIPFSMSINDFTPDGLPSYGVRPTSNGYEVYTHYKTILTGEAEPRVDNSYSLTGNITASFSSPILFERISGKTTNSSIDIFYKGTLGKKIIVSASGYFDIQQP